MAFISGIDPSEPGSTDSAGSGDDEIRQLKDDVQTSFPNINAEVSCTPTELNTLDGITSTTAELNILDGVTVGATEINYLDSLAENVQDALDVSVETSGNQSIAGEKTFTDTGGVGAYNTVKAFCTYDGTTTTSGFNLSGTGTFVGVYTFAFGTARANSNYVVLATPEQAGSLPAASRMAFVTSRSTTGFTVQVVNQNGNFVACDQLHVVVFDDATS